MPVNRIRLIRVGIVALIVLIALLLTYFAFLETMPGFLQLLKSGNEVEIEDYLRENNTIKGVICTVLLQFIQVLSIVLSGIPIQMAAGVVYGTWDGFIMCLFASTAAHAVSFFIFRRLGHQLDKWLPTSDTAGKLDFILKSDYPVYMVMLAFLIPVIPNGIIPIAASKTRLKLWEYVSAMCLGSIPNVLICCAIGNHIIAGDWLLVALLILALFGFVLLLWKYRDRVIAAIRKLGRRA